MTEPSAVIAFHAALLIVSVASSVSPFSFLGAVSGDVSWLSAVIARAVVCLARAGTLGAVACEVSVSSAAETVDGSVAHW